MNNSNRFIELDIWRGLAIVGMVIFHFFFILNFLAIIAIPYSEGGWLIFARLIQWSFLLLVGISLRLSYRKAIRLGLSKKDFLLRNAKRGLFVLGCAMMVSLATWLLIPEAYVRFGILHLIGASIILLSLIVDSPYLALLLSVALYAASFWLQTQVTSVIWLSILGLNIPGLPMLDYFPVIPWMAIPCLGIFLGYLYYENIQQDSSSERKIIQSEPGKILAWFGRHSLLIYMIHAPILMGIILLLHSLS